MKKFGIAVGLTLLSLVVTDIIGVLMCLFFEIFGGRSSSAALFYTIWFVMGVFCAVFIQLFGGNAIAAVGKWWPEEPDAKTTAWFLLPTATAILVALPVGFYLHDWRYGRSSGVYVPDSESHSLTFFITTFVSLIFFFQAMRPTVRKKTKRARSK